MESRKDEKPTADETVNSSKKQENQAQKLQQTQSLPQLQPTDTQADRWARDPFDKPGNITDEGSQGFRIAIYDHDRTHSNLARRSNGGERNSGAAIVEEIAGRHVHRALDAKRILIALLG